MYKRRGEYRKSDLTGVVLSPVNNATDTLPDDIEELKLLVLRQREELAAHRDVIDARDRELERLQEQLALLRAKRFGRSSEKYANVQGLLFDEAELESEIAALEAALEAAEQAKRERAASGADKTRGGSEKSTAQKTPKRAPLPEHLKRVEIVVDVSDEERQAMGDDWVLIGHESSEQLACQEREYYVKQIKRCKYVRKADATNKAKTTPIDGALTPGQIPQALLAPSGITVAAPLPVMLPKAIADATLLAKIIAGKYVDALSFNRERKVLEREGVTLSYTTICSYPIQVAERLEPLKVLFYEYAASMPRWHLDETTLQVLQEQERSASQKSHLWALRAGPPGAEIVLFHYATGRDYATLQNWLSEPLKRFEGVIVTDEHKPYARLAREHENILARGGCWAHARRKFVDAVKGRRHGSHAHLIIKRIAILYELEAGCVELSGDAKVERRRELIRPWMDEFYTLMDELATTYTDKSLLRTAIGYARNNRESLEAFIDHADLAIDNNAIENAIRPFTVGRRNWLYAGSPRGAAGSAFMYSLVESARGSGWEPKAYLQALFERWPYAKTTEERRQLLPMFLKNS